MTVETRSYFKQFKQPWRLQQIKHHWKKNIFYDVLAIIALFLASYSWFSLTWWDGHVAVHVTQVLHKNRIKFQRLFSLLFCTPTWPQWRCCWLRPCLSFLMYFAEHEQDRNNFWEWNNHICDVFVAIIISSAAHSISREEGLNVRNRLQQRMPTRITCVERYFKKSSVVMVLRHQASQEL